MSFSVHSVNPYIRVAMPSVLPAGTKIKRRVLFDYELIYVERGAFVLRYADCDYTCTAGQFLLLRPGVPHSFGGIVADLSQPHIHFDIVCTPKSPQIPVSFKDLCDFSPQERAMIEEDVFAGYPLSPFVFFNDTEAVLSLFYSITQDPKASALEKKASLIRIIDRLIADNFPACFDAAETTPDIARQLKDYIDAGQGAAAQLCDLEKQFSYSKYYLERQFKKQYGISLMAYRSRKRMETAEKLLLTESVTAAAAELGFSTIYAFSRAFKQHFGISPSAYKQQIKKATQTLRTSADISHL